MWKIEFFEKDNGRCPTTDFLDELSPETELPYIRNRFDQLAEHGNKLKRPHGRHLGDGIYELRVKDDPGTIPVLIFLL